MKGYHKVAMYKTKDAADRKANQLKSKFFSVKVQKGTVGTAWGKTKTCYRVWVR